METPRDKFYESTTEIFDDGLLLCMTNFHWTKEPILLLVYVVWENWGANHIKFFVMGNSQSIDIRSPSKLLHNKTCPKFQQRF